MQENKEIFKYNLFLVMQMPTTTQMGAIISDLPIKSYLAKIPFGKQKSEKLTEQKRHIFSILTWLSIKL